ncbi:MAG: xanthan lyase [Bacteroidales bacterium]
MRAFHLIHFLVFTLVILAHPAGLYGQRAGKHERAAEKRLKGWTSPVTGWYYPEELKIDSVGVDEEKKEVNIWFPVALSWNPMREETYARLLISVKADLGKKFNGYSINLIANGFNLVQLVPNYFRSDMPLDQARILTAAAEKPVLVSRPDGVRVSRGLDGRYIALWHSHGYYFDQPLDRWEWQRAKLFGSVEDLSVMAYVIPYLAPMLENSGATVFLPRERDIQVNEVIVDNDRSTGASQFVLLTSKPAIGAGRGFLMRDTLFTGDNPFLMGTSLRITDGSAAYIPEIPEKGYYGVTVSYPKLTDNPGKVLITVSHSGGTTRFVVDQSVGGGTWIWLGSFLFDAGLDAYGGAVTVTGYDGSAAALDAVRFGGGMGNVARRPAASVIPNQWSLNAGSQPVSEDARPVTVNHSWKLSSKPRFVEGARYWLQYAGMPDTVVYTPNRGKNDYNDDYMSRSEWVNYLLRKPDTSGLPGMGIPVDLSLAFHTDAGVTQDDSIIGTLGIYSTLSNGGLFPDGTSRLASRDLTDIIQTQIVEDVRVLFNPEWTRRGLWDRSYYEARKPDVPAMLLELLSHQNLADQRYGFDPRFRFHVSRAVYKGILRYLATASGTRYVVHPLPVSHMALVQVGERRVRLTWEPVSDPLESSADPASYRVYMSTGEGGFDNGTTVAGNSHEIELPAYNTLYSFRVTAVNEGGESFPSETLSVGLVPDSDGTVLIVNCFDRISGPSWFDLDGMAGVAWWNDRGVADQYNFTGVGDQYDFGRNSPWTDDDNAGWGSSYSDVEGRVIAGNSFDFPRIHGLSVMAAGRSFTSVSDEVFNREDFDLKPWCAADIILGEEKTTASAFDPEKKDFQIYTPEFLGSIERLKEAAVPVFVSGAYVGTDLVMLADTSVADRVIKTLHFKPRTDHAVRTGRLYATDIAGPFFTGSYSFNTGSDDDIYAAEAPDAIEPADKLSSTAFRYSENNTSAAVMHKGEVRSFVMGFPFETIMSKEERELLMKQILSFLLEK